MALVAVLTFPGQAVFAQDAPGLIGSFQVVDGPEWTTNPPTYSCLEACAEVFGGAAGDYSCSTTSDSIDHQAYVDGWGDSQYCSTPVAEDFKLNTFYDCGDYFCSYSAYVNDHDCTAVNYCFAAAPTAPVPVMNHYGVFLLAIVALLTGLVFMGRKAILGRQKP